MGKKVHLPTEEQADQVNQDNVTVIYGPNQDKELNS